MEKILVINPGSTSTKLGLYLGETCDRDASFNHPATELDKFEQVIDQLDYRRSIVLNWLDKEGIRLEELDAVAARGGIVRPLPSGTYGVNQRMVDQLTRQEFGAHASNLAAIMAFGFSQEHGMPAYMTDPLVVDEYQAESRIAGHPEFTRKNISHALNQKAVARKAARDVGKPYEECRFVVAHMGGGISVAYHYQGKMIDCNHGTDGEGPFSPERSGTLPMGDIIRYCFRSGKSEWEILRMICGNGGVKAYFGFTDMRKVEEMAANGDQQADLIFRAMAYQVAKEIGAMSVTGPEPPQAIVLTGGIAYSAAFVELIRRRVEFIAPILVYPGEDELEALALGTLRVLRGEETEKIY